MPRPKTKSELVDLSRKNYKKLNDYIDSFPDEELEKEFPDGYLNRNIRDVLGHLHYWHLMFLDWYKVGMAGQRPDMPAKGYTWKMTPALNRQIQKKFSDVELSKVRNLFNKSHSRVQEIIDKHTNKELFEKKRYKWTGSTSLGAYLVSATSSHYDWAYKLIRKCIE